MPPVKAWILDSSPGDYRLGEISPPTVGPDDVRLRVKASALNHMDLWLTKGLPRPKLPHISGCDAAGVVEAVGERVTTVAVGDEVVVNPAVSPLADVVALGNDSPLGRGFQVLGEHRWGGHGELLVVPSHNVVPRPSGRTWDECAAYPTGILTAWRMLRRARLAPGETLLVVGVGGGVASAACVLGVWLGARVFVTSTSEAKRAAALAMGAQDAFASDEDWPITADVVVETVGPATWHRSIRALRPGGRLVVSGGTSGPTVEIAIPRLFFKQHEIIGSTMGSYEEFDQATRLVEQGLPIPIDAVYDYADYPAALEHLRAGKQLGKIVLRHD